MKISYYISVAASGLCLLLSIILFVVGNSNQNLQAEVQKEQSDLQKQQAEINKGVQINKDLGPKLLRDMAEVSIKNEKMKALLGKHGYTVKEAAAATPVPGDTSPAPARSSGGESPALRP